MEFDSDKWRSLFEQSPIGIAYVGEDGTWLKVNDAMANILGYTHAELVGKMNFQEITHPSDLDADIEMTQRIAKGDIDYYEMIKRYISKYGKVVWVRLVVHAYREKGEFRHFITHVLPLVNGERQSRIAGEAADEALARMRTFKIKDFAKENWKWLLTIAAGAVIVIFNFFSELKQKSVKIDRLEEAISKLHSHEE